jgi:hypothetical protein
MVYGERFDMNRLLTQVDKEAGYVEVAAIASGLAVGLLGIGVVMLFAGSNAGAVLAWVAILPGCIAAFASSSPVKGSPRQRLMNVSVHSVTANGAEADTANVV